MGVTGALGRPRRPFPCVRFPAEAAVFGALEAGQPIICSMRPGDFTTAGHFIVLTGTQDGLLCVVDPNSPARSASLWEYSRLEPQIKNLWAYTA